MTARFASPAVLAGRGSASRASRASCAICASCASCARASSRPGLVAALRTGSASVTLELARLSAAFVERQGWTRFGYREPNDFAREMLDRSGRWLRDLAFLGTSFDRLPGLESALDGSDGGSPLGRMAALQVASIADPGTVACWVALARTCSFRELSDLVRQARARPMEPGASGTPGLGPEPAAAAGLELEEPDTEVRLELPLAAAAAFEEALELHRLVAGRSVGSAEFVEALLGEASSAGLPEVDPGPLPAGVTLVPVESDGLLPPGFERALSETWQDTPASLGRAAKLEEERAPEEEGETLAARWEEHLYNLDPAAMQWATDLLLRIQNRTQAAIPRGTRRLGWKLGGLLTLESEIERCIAHLLSLDPMSLGRGRNPGSAGRIAEELFGISRRTCERRRGLRRALAWLPSVRAAYEGGRLGQEAAWRVVRVLANGPADAGLERDWLRHAERLTVKRLQSEVLLVMRRRHGLAGFDGDDCRRPPTDAEWFASLRTVPGATRKRIEVLVREALASQCENVFLGFRLPAPEAQDFVSILAAAACRNPAGDPLAERPRGWAGLMTLLQDYASTWDDPGSMPKRAGEELHRRYGYRCMAPGCTARAALEVHHIQFRSQGGGDEDENLVVLCRWHHREAVHGGLARCRGRAPLEIRWELGRPGCRIRYCNERRLDA